MSTNPKVITMQSNPSTPKLSKHLQSLISAGSTRVSSAQLRMSMTSLQNSLPAGAWSLCQSTIRRSGRGFGVPTFCQFCDEQPPAWMHRTDLRRRWQSLHYAVHIKRGETAQRLEIVHGDVGVKKLVKHPA